MLTQQPSTLTRVVALGGGVIGRSWTALFLAAGRSVALYDPDPAAEIRVRDAVEDAWPVMSALGLTGDPSPGTLVVHDNARRPSKGRSSCRRACPNVSPSSTPSTRKSNPSFHLGAGDGGLAAFCERYSASFDRWWDDLGQPHLDPATTQRLVDGVMSTTGARTVEDLSTHRDALLAAVVASTHTRRPE